MLDLQNVYRKKGQFCGETEIKNRNNKEHSSDVDSDKKVLRPLQKGSDKMKEYNCVIKVRHVVKGNQEEHFSRKGGEKRL